MISKANISKVPLHPMLVTIPVGMWVFSLVAQIIHVARGGQSWRLASSYTMIGGVIGAVLALIPGMIDYLSLSDKRAKTLATRHMLLNLVITALFSTAFRLNIRGPSGRIGALVLAFIGAGLLLISGTLGFLMVFRYRVSLPDEPATSRGQQSVPQEPVLQEPVLQEV